MKKPTGLSVRLKLTLSYAGFLMIASTLLLAAVWLFLLRYVPDRAMLINADDTIQFKNNVFPIRSRLLDVFAPRAAAVLGILFVVSLVGGWFLAGRMLAPLNRITEATRKAAGGSLSHRIHMQGPNDEFHELANAFDNMLERLESHVDEQRRFAANASHELRTPLSITQTLLEVARSKTSQESFDVNELVDRLHTVNTRAIELTEALLLLSKADQRSFTPESVDLSLIAEEATETLLPLAERHGVSIETIANEASTIGSHPLLLQLATNLIHNAIVHNVSDGGRIWVATTSKKTGATLTVENTGEPLNAQTIAKFTEPFLRGDERVQSDHAGVGLGLAIVKSITEAHEGRLELRAREGGGLRVTAHLTSRAETRDQ